MPDFGRLLPLLLISDHGWFARGETPGVFEHAVAESFTRNAMWIARADPALAVAEVADIRATGTTGGGFLRYDPGSGRYVAPELVGAVLDADRLRRSWGSAQTGLKLAAFQVRYLLARPRWVRGGATAAGAPTQAAPVLLAEQCGTYDALGGRPDAKMVVEFQAEIKRVQVRAGCGAVRRRQRMAWVLSVVRPSAANQ